MLATPSKYGMSLVELFIKHAPNHFNLSNGIGHCTWLSIGDTDVDQRMTNITNTSNFPAPTGYNIENVDEKNEKDERDDEYNDKDDVTNTNEIHLLDDDENCGHRDIIDLVIVKQIVECESTRYVNFEVGDRSNDPKFEFEVENTSLFASLHDTQVNISNDNPRATFATISYHMPPTLDFLNMNGMINCVVID